MNNPPENGKPSMESGDSSTGKTSFWDRAFSFDLAEIKEEVFHLTATHMGRRRPVCVLSHEM